MLTGASNATLFILFRAGKDSRMLPFGREDMRLITRERIKALPMAASDAVFASVYLQPRLPQNFNFCIRANDVIVIAENEAQFYSFDEFSTMLADRVNGILSDLGIFDPISPESAFDYISEHKACWSHAHLSTHGMFANAVGAGGESLASLLLRTVP